MSCFLLLFFGLVWFGFVLFCFVLLILCLSRGGEKESKLTGGEGEDQTFLEKAVTLSMRATFFVFSGS